MAGTPKVPAKTGKSFAGAHSLYPEMAGIAPDPQNQNPMSKRLCISLPGEQNLSPASSASRNIMRFLRLFAASSSAGSELASELTQFHHPGKLSQR